MGILIDISIIIIMLICIFIGYRKGLIKVAIRFVAFILAIILALILYRPIANSVIENTDLDEKINETIYSKIKDVDFNNISEEDKNQNEIIKIAGNYIEEGLKQGTENTAKYISKSLSKTIVEAIVFISLLIALRIGLIVLNLLADIIGNLPIIKQFNKSGGIIYGIIEGLIIINCIFALLYIVNPIYKDGEIQENISKSNIGKIVYENNFIINTIIK